jgi:glutamine amidotransferase
MIGIVDYGMGNLRSVQKAFERVGADAQIVDQAEQIKNCHRLVLPGVGAFADAMLHLRKRDLIDPIKDFVASGRPFLGICLGLQLLFDRSEEDGEHQGLGLLGGEVVRFSEGQGRKIPQMGWNAITWDQPHPLLAGLDQGAHVYFVHSYIAQPVEASSVATRTEYGGPFCSSVTHENVFATQFHPEKSQDVGLKILENFAASRD